MKMRAMAAVLLGVVAVGVQAQMMDPQKNSSARRAKRAAPQSEVDVFLIRQQKAAQTLRKEAGDSCGKCTEERCAGPVDPRERAKQLLDRFAYGPRWKQVDHVLAWLGPLGGAAVESECHQ